MPCCSNGSCRHNRIATTSTLVTIGAAAGLMLGMLFARRSGKDLRKDLSKAGEKKGIKGALTILGSELQELGKDAYATGREAVESDTVQDAIEKGKKAVKTVKDKGQDIARKVEETLNPKDEA